MWVRLPPRAPIFLIEDERVVGAPLSVYPWCTLRFKKQLFFFDEKGKQRVRQDGDAFSLLYESSQR
jgi:hypothetical protein